VNAADVEELQKLFAAHADTNATKKAAHPINAKKVDSKSVLTYIDGKRAQNVTIALAQYKNVAPSNHDLLRAVCSLDSLGGRLGADQLENLRHLLPSSTELQNLSQLRKSEHPAGTCIHVYVYVYVYVYCVSLYLPKQHTYLPPSCREIHQCGV
jgi:hypothetical protein